MIYPSHYGDGNFGIDHPDTEPYRTILAALELSKRDLSEGKEDGKRQAIVRPWLQDFTASYLEHHIPYGPEEVRAQIQAVYDAGYDEWILWSASNRYTWDGLLSKEEGQKEEKEIARVRQSKEALTSSEETSAVKAESKASNPSTEAEKSLEGKIAKEETIRKEESVGKEETVQNKESVSEGKNKKTRKKPDVVIVTTGGSGN
jgi:hypothetical protein